MRTILKRYIFESGLDVIAPLKCGTRWLEGLDVDKRIHHKGFHIDELVENVHSGTTFIWRPVREHFHSALQTELATTKKDLVDIVTEMERGLCDHWSGELYKELYSIWSKTPFRFHKLRALSLLTPSASEMEYISTTYEFKLPSQWDSIEEALNSLSPKHLIRLNRLIGDEENRLKLMIESQYSEKNWEEYSDLEDLFLMYKSRAAELSAENDMIKDYKIVKDLQFKLTESNKLNSILQSKLDYTEMIMGKAPIKLI